MADEHSGSWIVYNGEVYNFREIRRDLEGEGVRFRTRSDTEVLLKALVRWGQGALERFEGMFAFAFWDGRKKELLLGRDPLGIKPLYYFRKPGLFLFGSELRALKASGLHDFALDKDGIATYLTFGSVIGPSTALSDVRELLPGHTLCLRRPDQEPSHTEYWSLSRVLPPHKEGFSSAFTDIVDSMEHILRKSVKSHLVSDVPVGIFLSGGVDSRLIANFAAAENEGGLRLLTVGFSEEEFSEVDEAKKVALRLGLPHDVVQVSGIDFERLLPEALASLDQPTVDGMNTFVISRGAAHVGLKVILSGVGGDEIFGGYTTFLKVPRLLRHHGLLRYFSRVIGRWNENPIQWEKIGRAASPRNLGDAYMLQRCIRWNPPGGWGGDGRGPLANVRREWDRMETLEDSFLAVALMELSLYMRNQLLRDTDVAGMANSLEIRVPFLDLNVIRAALEHPGRNHIGLLGGKRVTRAILKQLGNGNRIDRRKRGFLFPWKYWLRGQLGSMLVETLRDKSLYAPLGLTPEYGEQLLAAFQRSHPLVSWSEIWSLFVLLDWQRRYKYGDVSD